MVEDVLATYSFNGNECFSCFTLVVRWVQRSIIILVVPDLGYIKQIYGIVL